METSRLVPKNGVRKRKREYQEMREANEKARYGEMREISKSDWVSEVNKAGDGIWVVVHVYKQGWVYNTAGEGRTGGGGSAICMAICY